MCTGNCKNCEQRAHVLEDAGKRDDTHTHKSASVRRSRLVEEEEYPPPPCAVRKV